MYKYNGLKVHGKRIDEHRLVMEQYLGRKLLRNEVVHHKDGNKRNNEISNLELMSLSEHSSMHSKEREWSKEDRYRVSKWAKTHGKEISEWRSRPIDCYSKDGIFLKHYKSALEAEQDGFQNQHVIDVASGKRKLHNKCKFIYASVK